jgi:hypothetical protein
MDVTDDLAQRLPDLAPAELAGLSVTAVELPAGDRAGIF